MLLLHGWIELSLKPRDRWVRDSHDMGARDNGGHAAVGLPDDKNAPALQCRSACAARPPWAGLPPSRTNFPYPLVRQEDAR